MNILVILWSISISMSDITYDPEVAEIINSISQDSLVSTVASLSGEKSVIINGEKDSIPCRYAYSPGSYKAALWLKEQFEARGVSAELESFVPMTFTDIELLPSGLGWASASSQQLRMLLTPKYSLYKTTDAGKSWNKVDSLMPLGKITALSDDTAWGLTSKAIVITFDGLKWEVALDANDLAYLYDLCETDYKYGWSVGKNLSISDSKGVIFSTIDGWSSWTVDSSFSEGLEHVYFTSPKTGWVASSTSIWFSADGSKTWTKLEQPLKKIIEMEFSDSLQGYIIGETLNEKGAILKTFDAGNSWKILVDTLTAIPRDICLVGKDTIWIVGDADLAIFSVNAGSTWARKNTGSRSYLKTIDVLSDGRGAIGGQTTIRYTTDKNTWEMADTNNLDFMWNVTGTIQGQDSLEVILCAHYDASVADSTMRMVFAPGADDNASGCAMVLETARLMNDRDCKHTLKLTLLSGEEVGLWGSCRYAFQPREYLDFLNADMIAYDGNDDGKFLIHAFNGFNHLSKKAGEIFLDVVSLYGIGLTTHVDTTYYQRTDAVQMWLLGMPGISIAEDMENDFNPFYHSVDETLDKLNLPYFTEASKACVGWMAHMANLDALGIEEKPVQPDPEIVVLKLSSNIIQSYAYLEITSPVTPVTPVTPCIYDATGRRVKTLTPSKAAERLSGDLDLTVQRISIDVSDLPAGVYWVGVKGTTRLVSERFVVVR